MLEWLRRRRAEDPEETVRLALEDGARLFAEGRPLDAEKAYTRALDVLEAAGDRDPRIGDALHARGKVRLVLARLSEAEADQRPALDRRIALHGRESVEYAATLSLFGEVFFARFDLKEAEPRIREAHALRERLLGPEHAAVAESLTLEAHFAWIRGDEVEARALAERATAIRERVLGAEHPEIARSLGVSFLLAYHGHDFKAARAIAERSLALREKAHGPDHPELLRSLWSMGFVEHTAGQLVRALDTWGRALSIAMDRLGTDHPDAAWSRHLDALPRVGRLQPGPLRSHVRAVIEERLSPVHPWVGWCLAEEAKNLAIQGDPVAVALADHALGVLSRCYGPSHRMIANVLGRVAEVHVHVGRAAEAMPFYDRQLRILEDRDGKDARTTIPCFEVRARALLASGDRDAARAAFERIQERRRAHYGEEHWALGLGFLDLARVAVDAGDRATAEAHARRALEVFERTLPKGHPEIVGALTLLADLLDELGRGEEADALYARAGELDAKTRGRR